MHSEDRHWDDSLEWVIQRVGDLTDTVTTVKPSEWAETYRYLPASATDLPGPFRYDVCPPLRDIADCLDIHSSVREVSLKKGAQIGATTGILENAIGYIMAHVKSSPSMMLTADDGLARMRMEQYIIPMINQSGLSHLISASDEDNKRRTGKTAKRLEWEGGGFLMPVGAQSANKLRMVSIQFLLEDETDGYPLQVGRDGKPHKLAEARTKGFYNSRKILRLSTPTIKGQSVIDEHYHEGDQRKCMVPCKGCGEYQELVFQKVDRETGEVWGLVWETDDQGYLVPGSVRYVCKFCGHKHTNADKKWMLPKYKWVPTATPISPDVRSYHFPALYAPAAMYPWEAIVRDYLQAWDVGNNRPRDMGLLQEFYNNALGEVFELRGDKLRFSTVSAHRRSDYSYGEVPNELALRVSGSQVLILLATVDVQDGWLAVGVFGFTKGGRVFLVDYWHWEGDPYQLDDAETWGQVRNLVESGEYHADDGSVYSVAACFVDSGYMADVVYRFCAEYEVGVFPIKGQTDIPAKAAVREFSQFKTPMRGVAYGIRVDMYKDRASAALRRSWDGVTEQPEGHFNAPATASDKAMKELTAEHKREKLEKTTGRRVGYEWHRPQGARNELWDLLIYALAGLDIIAWDLCVNQQEMEAVNWPAFWALAESEQLFYDLGQ